MATTTATGAHAPTLLTTSNPKTAKSSELGFSTAILHLAPHTLAGGRTVCPYATAGCIAGCLNLAGRGGIFPKGASSNRIQEARIRRTRYWFEDRAGFLEALEREIQGHVNRCNRAGVLPAVRLNGTSDIAWEREAPALFERFEGVRFYDYTKARHRARRFGVGELPPNYHLTYSRSEKTTPAGMRALLAKGVNVAVVFRELPQWTLGDGTVLNVASVNGWPMVDGDRTDLRFTDPRGVIVALKAKGPARRDRSGFVLEDAHALPNGGAA